jgi:hypothetical protein
MADVMISYTRADVEKTRILDTLLRNEAIGVWWDDQLTPGVNFTEEIANQIEASACVVMLLSKASQPREWVQGEAISAGNKLIPIVVEQDLKVLAPVNTKSPLYLVDWEASPPKPDFEKLMRRIRELVAEKNAALPTGSRPLRARFRQSQTRSLGRMIRETLSGRWSPGVDHPLYRDAERFLMEPEWHERIAKMVHDALEGAGDAAFAFVADPLRSIAWNAAYPDIADQLQAALMPENSARLNRLKAQLAAESEDLQRSLAEKVQQGMARRAEQQQQLSEVNAKLKVCDVLRELLHDLQAEVRQPEYRKCFLVAGSPGAGKSYLIASLLNARTAEDGRQAFLLPLEWDGQESSLEPSILRGFEKVSGQAWRSLRELLQFQENAYPGARLVVVLEDLEQLLLRNQGLADYLAGFLLRSTELHKLRWILTLNASRYDEVSAQSREWKQLGCRDRIDIAGWLDLDTINRETEIGLKIVRHQIAAGPGTRRLTLDFLSQAEADNTVKRNLSNPFLAWVLLALDQESSLPVDRLVTLSFAEFIESFWAQRMEQMHASGLTRARLEQAVWLIAGLVFEGVDLQPEYGVVQKHLMAASANGEYSFDRAEAAAGALATLADENLIGVYYDTAAGSRQRMELRFEGFWQFQIARQIAGAAPVSARNAGESISLLETWAGLQQRPYLAEGVLEFLLLKIASGLTDGSAIDAFSKALWRSPLEGHGLPAAAPWLAATRAPRPVQADLAQWLREGGISGNDRRTVFAVASFCVDALPGVLTVPARMRILQRFFGAFHEFHLESYYLYAVERLLPQAADPTELGQAMLCFAGCEILGITEELAKITMDEIEERLPEFDDSAVLMQNYLRADWPQAKKEEDEETTSPRRADHDGPGLSFYREWVIRKYLRNLVSHRGLAAYDFLEERKWYRAFRNGIENPNSFYMVREANFAFGLWYRTRHKQEDRQAYVDLVRDLVRSGVKSKRKVAYYLMLHSVQTEGKAAVRIDEVFHRYLKKLRDDPALQLPPALFRANLP